MMRRRDNDRTSDRIRAEAAAWLARLQSSARTEDSDRAFRVWLDNDAHRAAFEQANEIWDILPGAARLETIEQADRPRVRWRQPVAALASAAAIMLMVGHFWTARLPVYETGVGQQQSVTLDDGTRIALNTDSAVTIDYKTHSREVRLDRGEAMFEVSKDPSRPFIVTREDKQIRALGTRFVVREGPQRVAVTLVEGSVEVSRLQHDQPVPIARLRPGERITLVGKAGALVDRPAIDVVTAWRKGEVMFDDVMLFDAVNEFNRYNARTAIVADPDVAVLRISGTFTTRDPADFAATIAALYGLRVENRGTEIRIHAGTDPAVAK